MDDSNTTNSSQSSNDDSKKPVIQPTGDDGSLPSGLGEPIDTSSIQIPPHPDTNFNDQEFVELLSGSVSLTKSEKMKIIERIPNLSQYQIDRLLQIFRDEKEKFSQIGQSSPDQVSDLEMQKQMEWKDIESEQKEKSERTSEQDRISELQNKLNN